MNIRLVDRSEAAEPIAQRLICSIRLAICVYGLCKRNGSKADMLVITVARIKPYSQASSTFLWGAFVLWSSGKSGIRHVSDLLICHHEKRERDSAKDNILTVRLMTNELELQPLS